jgi:putative DNA primase/helicase
MLQALNPKIPIRIKVLEGSCHSGEDSELYRWLPFVNIWGKVKQPIYTRGILPNEILIDPDSPEWQVMKEGIEKLSLYCKENNIPFNMGFSGGKGIHVSIYFGNIVVDAELEDEIKKADIDFSRTVRKALVTALAEKAGVDLEAICLDWGKINFSVANKGSQVRTFGTTRAPGLYKTLIDKTPDHKPDPYELPLIFPEKVELWAIEGTEFKETVLEALKKEVERAKSANEYVLKDVDFSDTEIMEFPCIKRLFEAGIKNGRYYAGVSVLLICQKCGITKEETKKYLTTLFKTFPGITQTEVDLRIDNALTMYGKDYKFSCRQLKETFGEEFCNFSKCPVKKEIEVVKGRPFSYDECIEQMKKVTPKAKDSERVQQALEFVKRQVLAREGDITKMELFIEEEVFRYFNIPAGKNSNISRIFRNGFKDIIKNKKNEQKKVEYQKIIVNDDTFNISPEFNGLYEIKPNGLGKLVVTPFVYKIARKVSEKLHIIVFKGNLFAYADGYYRHDPYLIRAEATRILNGILKNGYSNGIANRLKDVMTSIENSNLVNEYPFNKYSNAFPVKNGVIVFDWEKGTVKLEDPDPEKWKFNFILPVEYRADADPEPLIKELANYVPNHRLLVQPLAQAILQSMGYGPYKALYMLKGPKNTGKTTILDMYLKFVGEFCRSTVPFQELAPQFVFSKAALEGKLINTQDDMGYFKMSDTGVIKGLTGGYHHEIQRKRKDPYSGIITTVYLVTTNTPPGFDRRIYLDDAFWERWYYVEFNHIFNVNDSFQIDFFSDGNMSALLNAVIAMMIQIKKMGSLIVPKMGWEKTRDTWIQEGNALYKFIKENMVIGGETAIIREQLVIVVRKWCEDTRAVKSDAIPTSTTDMNYMVEILGGKVDEQRRFECNNGEEKKYCYILPYTWKPISSYKRYTHKCLTDREIPVYQLNIT